MEQVLHAAFIDPAATDPSILEVGLQGVTTSAHETALFLNGNELGIAEFQGRIHTIAEIQLPPGRLQEGENTVTLVPGGGESDVVLLDFVRLTYPRKYHADGDALRSTAPGGSRLTIEGFTTADIRVFDVTDLTRIRSLPGQVDRRGTGFAITLSVTGGGQRTLYAVSGSRIQTPHSLLANRPSSWHREDREADIAIITPEEFLESFQPLKLFRETQGWRVALIPVEDIYDEFSFGRKTPGAVKAFCEQASTRWQGAPRFLLLAGDASLDPRGYLETGILDRVPTKLVETTAMETASDDWFADFDGDGMPELAVGRLPVASV